jgi:hypothetical protein
MDTVGGDAGVDSQLDESKTTVGCFAGWFDDDGTSRGKCGGNLAGYHCGWEVPRRHNATDSNGLFERENGCVGQGRGNDIAVDTGGFLAEPLNEGCGIHNLALRLSQCLSVLEGQDLGH